MSKALVVDDDEIIRFILRQTLENDGYEVFEASNGKEALEHQRRQSSDLVVTDVLMPEKDGFEVIREIKREDPDTKIIVMSGGGIFGDVDFVTMGRNFGADAALQKPFNPKDLITLAQEIRAPELCIGDTVRPSM